MSEILNKIEELKAMAKKAEALASEIESAVSANANEAMEAMNSLLDKGMAMDKSDRAEFIILSQQHARFEDMKGRIETAAYKLSTEVVGNLERIA
ncbi:MAG: hypothetical protein NC453_10655 [Muribaculum sp.]|nr:hypothetical protein [Muribaculum sp.]